VEPIGPLPGRENLAVVVECGRCQAQSWRVSFIAVPVAAARQPGLGGRFLLLAAKGAPDGERLSPRYCLECLECGLFVLADPEGPDSALVRGDTNNN